MRSDQAHLRLIIDAKSERSALRVVERLRRLVEAEVESIEPYNKGGFECCLALSVAGASWPDKVVSVVSAAQSFGYGWTISGSIDEEVDIVASRFSVPGLEFANLTLRRF